MPNINAFRPVVYEKKNFEDLAKFSLFWPLLGPERGQPLYLNNLNQACILPSLVEIGSVVLEKMFKGKFDGWTDGRRTTA